MTKIDLTALRAAIRLASDDLATAARLATDAGEQDAAAILTSAGALVSLAGGNLTDPDAAAAIGRSLSVVCKDPDTAAAAGLDLTPLRFNPRGSGSTGFWSGPGGPSRTCCDDMAQAMAQLAADRCLWTPGNLQYWVGDLVQVVATDRHHAGELATIRDFRPDGWVELLLQNETCLGLTMILRRCEDLQTPELVPGMACRNDDVNVRHYDSAEAARRYMVANLTGGGYAHLVDLDTGEPAGSWESCRLVPVADNRTRWGRI